ncbi:hypothetical protein SLS54_000527 [Diplodia seriata]
MRKLHRIDIGSFEHYRQKIISQLGRRERVDGRARPKAFYKVPFSGLQSWLNPPPDDGNVPPKAYAEWLSHDPITPEQVACSNTFWHVRQEVDAWKSRPHYWHIFGLIIFSLQLIIFVAGIGPLFLNMGTPLFMFSCEQYLSSLWMLITAATNAVFRFVMWEFSSHERVRVYPLSEKTKDSLDTFIQTPKDEQNGETGIPRSTETELPPRYHPLIGRGLRVYYRTVSLSATSAKKQYHRWGGNIFVVSYTIALLLVFVTGGRLLSLLYIWQSAKTLGLHVIECQTNAQISGSLRILCSMTGVLVVVNGAYYYDGHRLDERQGWNAWREKYDRGDYDKDNDKDHDNALTRSRHILPLPNVER